MPIHRAGVRTATIGLYQPEAVELCGITTNLGLVLKAFAREGRLRKAGLQCGVLAATVPFINWLDESGAFSKGCDADILDGRAAAQEALDL